MANTVALSEGALTADSMEDKAVVGRIKRVGLNLATIPREIIYQLQDEATAELRARDGRAV